MNTIRSVLILFSIWVCVQADICFDDDDNTLYCDYGCCGLDDEYCCYDSYWGAANIAGTVVGLTFFFIFVALIVVCCRRRRRLGPVFVQQQNAAGVTVVHSSSAQQLNSVAANVAPVYPQYPAPPQPGYPPPGYPVGQAQPPPYTPS